MNQYWPIFWTRAITLPFNSLITRMHRVKGFSFFFFGQGCEVDAGSITKSIKVRLLPCLSQAAVGDHGGRVWHLHKQFGFSAISSPCHSCLLHHHFWASQDSTATLNTSCMWFSCTMIQEPLSQQDNPLINMPTVLLDLHKIAHYPEDLVSVMFWAKGSNE